MENLTPTYLSKAEFWLCLSTLIYFLMNGAQIFETLVFVPKWTTSPPDNFNLLMDGQSVSLKNFWIILHSIHEITFILAIIFCWKIEPVRNWLLILFALHFAVRVWTILYFAPNIMDFQATINRTSISQNLIQKVMLWKNLNYLRVGIYMLISIGLIPLCIKVLNIKSN